MAQCHSDLDMKPGLGGGKPAANIPSLRILLQYRLNTYSSRIQSRSTDYNNQYRISRTFHTRSFHFAFLNASSCSGQTETDRQTVQIMDVVQRTRDKDWKDVIRTRIHEVSTRNFADSEFWKLLPQIK